MATYVLIVMLYKGGVAMHEFNGKQACLNAAQEARRQHKEDLWGDGGISVVCVPRT